jgi:hypothetical protein
MPVMDAPIEVPNEPPPRLGLDLAQYAQEYRNCEATTEDSDGDSESDLYDAYLIDDCDWGCGCTWAGCPGNAGGVGESIMVTT